MSIDDHLEGRRVLEEYDVEDWDHNSESSRILHRRFFAG